MTQAFYPALTISLEPDRYDQVVHNSLPEGGNIEICAKRQVEVGASPVAVAVTFSVQLPDGTIHRAQATTSLRCLEAGIRAIESWASVQPN